MQVCCRFCLVVLFSLSARAALAQPFDKAPKKLRIMSWNVEWMFDHYRGDNRSDLSREQSAPSKEYWQNKLSGVAEVIAGAEPEIVALQEIEGFQTLRDLARHLDDEHDLNYRFAFIQGTDSFTEQDVGLLFRYKDVHAGLVAYRRHEQSQTMFSSREFYNLSKHLVADFRWSDVEQPLTLLNVHLRARAEGEPIRERQAKLARLWLEPHLAAGEDVILVGDLNSEHASGDIQGEMAVLIGDDTQPKMVDLVSRLEDSQASTHLILDKQFDRMLVSQSLIEDGAGLDWCFESIVILDEAIVRGTHDGEEHWENRQSMSIDELDLSDHFPLLATFELK